MEQLAAKISQIWNTLSGISVLWAVLAVLFALVLYFLPTILAGVLGNTTRRTSIIGVLNLIFGWTGIGWFALMGWAMLGRPKEPEETGPVEDLAPPPFFHTPGTN
jgi:hypothetical protein